MKRKRKYTRTCKRCGKLFITSYRHARICLNCALKKGGKSPGRHPLSYVRKRIDMLKRWLKTPNKSK